MNEKLKQLAAAYHAKNQQLQVLANLPAEELTAEKIGEMAKLRDEMKALRAEIDQLQEAMKASQDADEFMRTAMNGMVPMPGDTPAARSAAEAMGVGSPLNPGAASVLGFRSATSKEQVYLEYKSGSVDVVDLGEGMIIPKKQFEAISTTSYRNAFDSYVRHRGEIHAMDTYDQKVLSEGSDTAGGYLVPIDLLQRMSERKPTPTRLRANVTTIQTGRDTVGIPQVNYTAQDNYNKYTTPMRVTWTGEQPSSSTVHRVSEPRFGTVNIPVHTAMMSLPITLDLLEDSMFPLGNWIADKFAETVELTEESEIISGPGTDGRMRGILAAPGTTGEVATVVTGSAAALTADGLLNLAWDLPEQYDENARYYLNKTNSGKTIATLKDTTNRYLFSTGHMDDALASARPSTIAGYPLSWVGFMPDQAANAYPVLFGDARGYTKVNRIGLSITVLKETYLEQNQWVIVGRFRVGGKTVEPWRMRAQKCST